MDAVSMGNSIYYYISIEPRLFSGERVSVIANGDEAILDSDMTFVR